MFFSGIKSETIIRCYAYVSLSMCPTSLIRPFTISAGYISKQIMILYIYPYSFQVLNLKQSYVAMRIPLYVSYVFHSPLHNYCWLHFKRNNDSKHLFVFYQVLNLKQSYVAMRIPLYVSYVFHSPIASGGWLHFDLTSQLQLTFVYDTSILWQNGISSPEAENGLQGKK